jgi:hypothetical protein
MQARTYIHTVIERINALREQVFQGGLNPKQLREVQRQIVYWRRRLAVLLSPEHADRRSAAAG